MSDSTIQIEVKGTAAAFLKTLTDPSQVLRALARTTDQQNLLTASHIQKEYLSFSKSSPATMDGLRVQTNRLRNSIRPSQCRFMADGLESSIGSNVEYAAIHEFGADIPSRPTRSRNKYYAKKHPTTKAYSLPERRPVRRGISDRLSEYTSAFGNTILKLT